MSIYVHAYVCMYIPTIKHTCINVWMYGRVVLPFYTYVYIYIYVLLQPISEGRAVAVAATVYVQHTTWSAQHCFVCVPYPTFRS